MGWNVAFAHLSELRFSGLKDCKIYTESSFNPEMQTGTIYIKTYHPSILEILVQTPSTIPTTSSLNHTTQKPVD